MKGLARPSFFRVFDLLLATSNPGLKLSRWTYDGVEFERERHSVMGPKHGLAIEIYTLARPGRRGWTLMVTKEYWWAGEESKALKNLRWARPTNGQRADILSWLRTQEAALERSSSIADVSMSREAEVDTTDEEADDDEIDKASDGGGVSRLTKKSA
jgi:hypothetical protein